MLRLLGRQPVCPDCDSASIVVQIGNKPSEFVMMEPVIDRRLQAASNQRSVP
jgi:hypothetical protein